MHFSLRSLFANGLTGTRHQKPKGFFLSNLTEPAIRQTTARKTQQYKKNTRAGTDDRSGSNWGKMRLVEARPLASTEIWKGTPTQLCWAIHCMKYSSGERSNTTALFVCDSPGSPRVSTKVNGCDAGTWASSRGISLKRRLRRSSETANRPSGL